MIIIMIIFVKVRLMIMIRIAFVKISVMNMMIIFITEEVITNRIIFVKLIIKVKFIISIHRICDQGHDD